MVQKNIRVKIFTAAVDARVDTYLEKEIEKWRVGTPYFRTIEGIFPALSQKEIMVFVTFIQELQDATAIQDRLSYLLLNGKKIFDRNLLYEDYIEMGFSKDIL